MSRRIDNSPSRTVAENLEALVYNVLDPLHEAYGKPIYVNSGYRSARLNLVVGGAKNSQHMTGEAVDITTGTKDGNIWSVNNLAFSGHTKDYEKFTMIFTTAKFCII